jgi:hypothetical protein
MRKIENPNGILSLPPGCPFQQIQEGQQIEISFSSKQSSVGLPESAGDEAVVLNPIVPVIGLTSTKCP